MPGATRSSAARFARSSPRRKVLSARRGQGPRAQEIGPFLNKYAGKQLLTGEEAKAYADHFIAVHLQEIGGGKTYAQLSAASLADPTNKQLAGQVDTVFRGETLRGLLLNAYAFGKIGTIAGIASVVSFIGAGVMFLLAGLGLWHRRRTPWGAELFDHASATSWHRPQQSSRPVQSGSSSQQRRGSRLPTPSSITNRPKPLATMY